MPVTAAYTNLGTITWWRFVDVAYDLRWFNGGLPFTTGSCWLIVVRWCRLLPFIAVPVLPLPLPYYGLRSLLPYLPTILFTYTFNSCIPAMPVPLAICLHTAAFTLDCWLFTTLRLIWPFAFLRFPLRSPPYRLLFWLDCMPLRFGLPVHTLPPAAILRLRTRLDTTAYGLRRQSLIVWAVRERRQTWASTWRQTWDVVNAERYIPRLKNCVMATLNVMIVKTFVSNIRTRFDGNENMAWHIMASIMNSFVPFLEWWREQQWREGGRQWQSGSFQDSD